MGRSAFDVPTPTSLVSIDPHGVGPTSAPAGAAPTPRPSYAFQPHERPMLPGGPFTPGHPAIRKAGYFAVGLGAAVLANLGNGLVSVNANVLAGPGGFDLDQVSLLSAIFLAFSATSNLMLVKGRTQFGIPAITLGALLLYAATAALQLVVPGFGAAIAVRACAGVAAAALLTFSIYNFLQVFPPKARPLALLLTLGLAQLGNPLARMIPVDLIAYNNWQGQRLLELAVPLSLYAAGRALPLPPSERSPAFAGIDFVTYGCILAALLLVCFVLGEGRLLWWTDTPWLGWALAAAVPLLAVGIGIERLRTRPLLQLDWLTSRDILRFAGVALLVRLALAEQSYGAVGLLTAGGLTNDQLRTLFEIVTLAMIAGIAAATLTVSERRLPYQVMAAALVIAAGAWIDANANSLTRPPQLYLSQALIGFGTTLFVGPALIYGFTKMMQRGADHLVSFVVLFSLTQNVGGLVGSAFLGSYQTVQARAHAVRLAADLAVGDTQVAQRIAGLGAGLSHVVGDPVVRAATGAGLLGQSLAREAAVRAFNDCFRLVAALALLTAIYVGFHIALAARRRRAQFQGNDNDRR